MRGSGSGEKIYNFIKLSRSPQIVDNPQPVPHIDLLVEELPAEPANIEQVQLGLVLHKSPHLIGLRGGVHEALRADNRLCAPMHTHHAHTQAHTHHADERVPPEDLNQPPVGFRLDLPEQLPHAIELARGHRGIRAPRHGSGSGSRSQAAGARRSICRRALGRLLG